MKIYTHCILFFLMVLTPIDIVELIKKPKNGALLKEAVKEEKVLKALATGEHEDSVVDDFANLLVQERRQRFKSTFEFHTMPILDKVTTHYERIFDAQGRFIEAKFTKPEQKQDFEQYFNKCFVASTDKEILNGIDAESFFRKIGIDALLYQPNTILYLDLPKQSSAKRTTATVQTVSVSKIWDVVATARGIEYVIIYNERKEEKGKVKQYFVIDDEKYSLYETKSSKTELISESKHEFQFCPATFISNRNRFKNEYSIRQSPIWQSIPDLKAWIFLKNLAKVYQWESGVPIKYEPEAKCAERHPTGAMCENGKFILSDGKIATCSSCLRRSQEKMAWGKVIRFPLEHFKSEGAELIFKAFQYGDFNTDVMEFNENDLDKKRKQIEEDLIGERKTASKSKEARNEMDVQSDTEDMKRILSSASETIELCWDWIATTTAQSRKYDSFINYTSFLGRGYLLQSKAKHQEEYKTLVQSGADDLVLNKKLAEIIQTEYGYDQKFVELFEMLGAIIPYRHLPLEKVYAQQAAFTSNTQLQRDFYLRIYAANWIQEFLVLNDVQIWGEDVDSEQRFYNLKEYFSEKIDFIITQQKDLSIQNTSNTNLV